MSESKSISIISLISKPINSMKQKAKQVMIFINKKRVNKFVTFCKFLGINIALV